MRFDAAGQPVRDVPPTRRWADVIVPLLGCGMLVIGVVSVVSVSRDTRPLAPIGGSGNATPVVITAPLPTLIFFQEVPTATSVPTVTPTVDPVVAAWTATPTPTLCPTTPASLPRGAVCVWPFPTIVATAFPLCETPVPGDTCDPHGRRSEVRAGNPYGGP